MSDLNDKQQRFCEEYTVDFNAKQAAIRAGYTPKTAEVQGVRLLSYAKVQSYIQELKQKLSEKTGITKERIVLELERIGFNNIQDYLDSGNQVKDLTKIDRGLAASVAQIKIENTTFDGGEKETITFKLHNKLDALEKLAKYIGLYAEDNKQRSSVITVNAPE